MGHKRSRKLGKTVPFCEGESFYQNNLETETQEFLHVADFTKCGMLPDKVSFQAPNPK
jgi:hypothetical protein